MYFSSQEISQPQEPFMLARRRRSGKVSMGQDLSNTTYSKAEEEEWPSVQNPLKLSSIPYSWSSCDSRIGTPYGLLIGSECQVVDHDKGQPSLSYLLELLARKARKKYGAKEEEKLIISKKVVMKERWIQHYSSSHKILLVGEGDFSFSASLSVAFGSATSMFATSLDSTGFLIENYQNAMSNIHELSSRGCMVMHDVDATRMAKHCSLKGKKFDRVVFNFPHAGFIQGEARESQVRRHQILVFQFLANAKKMLLEGGEIHITHKSWGFFLDWNLEELASIACLQLTEELPFNFRDYTGYRTKYGFGGDKNFNCNPSKTYKFIRKPPKIEVEYIDIDWGGLREECIL